MNIKLNGKLNIYRIGIDCLVYVGDNVKYWFILVDDSVILIVGRVGIGFFYVVLRVLRVVVLVVEKFDWMIVD